MRHAAGSSRDLNAACAGACSRMHYVIKTHAFTPGTCTVFNMCGLWGKEDRHGQHG